MPAFIKSGFNRALCVENDCAVEFTDGKLTKVVSAGGKAFVLEKNGDGAEKKEIK